MKRAGAARSHRALTAKQRAERQHQALMMTLVGLGRLRALVASGHYDELERACTDMQRVLGRYVKTYEVPEGE